jgi:hypothetical protein
VAAVVSGLGGGGVRAHAWTCVPCASPSWANGTIAARERAEEALVQLIDKQATLLKRSLERVDSDRLR